MNDGIIAFVTMKPTKAPSSGPMMLDRPKMPLKTPVLRLALPPNQLVKCPL